jgi:hypothetical protein
MLEILSPFGFPLSQVTQARRTSSVLTEVYDRGLGIASHSTINMLCIAFQATRVLGFAFTPSEAEYGRAVACLTRQG